MKEDISKISNGRLARAQWFSTTVTNGHGDEEFVCVEKEGWNWILERGERTPVTISTVAGLRAALYNIAQYWNVG